MGKVLKADATAAVAWAEKDLGTPQSVIWLTYRLRYTAAALALWAFDGESGFFDQMFEDTHSFAFTYLYLFDTGSGLQWSDYNMGADGPMTPDTWLLVEQRFENGGPMQAYINGSLVIDGVDTNLTDLRFVQVGWTANPPGADSIVYMDDVKIGTTRGGSDLFADDFEDGTLDAWSSTDGDVSVIDDPFVVGNSIVVFDRPSWRWIITDLRTSRVLTELTSVATEITTSRLLAASWPAALTVPSDDPRVRSTYVQFDGHPEWDEPFVAKDIRALIGLRNTGIDPDPVWEPAYAGIPKQVVDRVVDGVPQTTINCWDVRKYLEFLPLVDADGDLPGPNGNTFTSAKANVIARTALQNWITNNPGCLAETLFDLTTGLDEDCVELTMTFGRGTTINDVWTQLEQTGAIDIVLDPVFDPRARPGCLAVVNFEVEHGTEQHAAIFSWDRSPRSLPEISRMEDGLKDANTIQDYTDDVEPATPATDTDSVMRIGEYWAMRTWVGQPDADAVTAFAAEEILFRTNGQTTVTASPAAPRSLQPIQQYDIGDRVPVYASERLRKPIASTMRIYAIPFTIDESAHETVSELVVSADAVS